MQVKNWFKSFFRRESSPENQPETAPKSSGGLPELTSFQRGVLVVGYFVSTVLSVYFSFTGGYNSFESYSVGIVWGLFALMGCAMPAASYYFYTRKAMFRAVLFGAMSFVSLFFSVSGSYLTMQLDAQAVQLRSGAGDAYVTDRRGRMSDLQSEAAELRSNMAALTPLINDRNGAGNNGKTQREISSSKVRLAEIDSILASLQVQIDNHVPQATIGAVFNSIGTSFGFDGGRLFHFYTLANATAIDILVLVLSLFNAAAGVFIMKTVDGRIFVNDGELKQSFLFDFEDAMARAFSPLPAAQMGGVPFSQFVMQNDAKRGSGGVVTSSPPAPPQSNGISTEIECLQCKKIVPRKALNHVFCSKDCSKVYNDFHKV